MYKLSKEQFILNKHEDDQFEEEKRKRILNIIVNKTKQNIFLFFAYVVLRYIFRYVRSYSKDFPDSGTRLLFLSESAALQDWLRSNQM